MCVFFAMHCDAGCIRICKQTQCLEARVCMVRYMHARERVVVVADAAVGW